MRMQGIDVLCLQDTRVSVELLPLYKAQVKVALGAQVRCFIDGGDSIKGPVKVGGNMIIIGQL